MSKHSQPIRQRRPRCTRNILTDRPHKFQRPGEKLHFLRHPRSSHEAQHLARKLGEHRLCCRRVSGRNDVEGLHSTSRRLCLELDKAICGKRGRMDGGRSQQLRFPRRPSFMQWQHLYLPRRLQRHSRPTHELGWHAKDRTGCSAEKEEQ